jgi:hypothetical protein
MIASNIGHGTTAAISARNTSRFVRFLLLAKSSDVKLNCAVSLESELTAYHVPNG